MGAAPKAGDETEDDRVDRRARLDPHQRSIEVVGIVLGQGTGWTQGGLWDVSRAWQRTHTEVTVDPTLATHGRQ